jgi:hypothetical protein
MAKEWANKDMYHPSDGVLEPCVQMPRAKASVRTVPTWGERKAIGGAVGRATPVRPVLAWTDSNSGFVLVHVRGLVREVVVLVVGLESFAGGQVARCSPSRAQYGDGRSRSFEMERRDSPWAFFRGFGPPLGGEGWFPHGGYRGGVRGGSFGRKDGLVCANPTFEQMARH